MPRTPEEIRAAMLSLEQRFDSGEILEKTFLMRYMSLREELDQLQLARKDIQKTTKVVKLQPGITCRQFCEMELAGHYRILRELGRGGMGIVYLAEDINFKGQRVVAIKILPQYLCQSPETLESFKREFLTASKLVHQNICAMYEFGEDTKMETYFLVIEYLEGENLADLLGKRKRYSFKETIYIATQIATGLDFAHSKGIIHLDMKPANIMILPTGDVKIMDFGLAQQLHTGKSYLSLPKTFGTPMYVAPEQIQAGKENIVRAATDMWALGVIVYEMLKGEPPFQGNTILQVSNSIVTTQPEPIKGISEKAWNAILKALSKDPHQRFSRCKDFIEALRGDNTLAITSSFHSSSIKSKTSASCQTTSKMSAMPSHLVQKSRVMQGIFWLCLLIFSVTLILFLHVWISKIYQKPQKNAEPSSPKTKQTPEISPSLVLPQYLIEKCWKENNHWDFTCDTWLKLSVSQQNLYAASYQKWYASRHSFPLEKEIAIQGKSLIVRLIPPGQFWMGSPEGEPGRYEEEKRYCVLITKPFWMGKYEITQEEWSSVMEKNPSFFQHAPINTPVDSVSWEDALSFAKKIGAKLPTEAQWEYACRSGTTTMTYIGNFAILGMNNAPLLDKIAWYAGNSGVEYPGGFDSKDWPERQYHSHFSGTQCIGQKQPNAWGLHDMIGNIAEWCNDWDAPYPLETKKNPVGPPQGKNRVRRGGCWSNMAHVCRSSTRSRWETIHRPEFMGVRIVLDCEKNR
ncbi:MAG: SUMF1/EgtB/PvdO family nonheme iron enzyme [Candidatus Brocadiae bacterium]|nr:SUMF1/EgtB/PvdO family nonheme iron enzyme [Candidatus Brocadiia bacterium]